MSNKTSKKQPAALPHTPKEVIDQFVSGPMTGEAVNAATMAFKKALIERALGAELSHHLGYPPGTDKPAGHANHRNGVSNKTVLTDDGPLRIDIPRDRGGSFERFSMPNAFRRTVVRITTDFPTAYAELVLFDISYTRLPLVPLSKSATRLPTSII